MRKLLHRFELRLAVMAALALLIAQLGAMSHAYSHDAGAPTTHRAAANSHDLCDQCLAFAPLLAAADAPLALPTVEPQGRGLATRPAGDSLIDLSLTLAFRSRAPPYTP